MLRKILVLAVVSFFVIGTLSAMAGEQGKCCDKSPLQSMYNWFSGWGAKSGSTCCCKACGTQCCSSCNTDCGGKCCSACKAKK